MKYSITFFASILISGVFAAAVLPSQEEEETCFLEGASCKAWGWLDKVQCCKGFTCQMSEESPNTHIVDWKNWKVHRNTGTCVEKDNVIHTTEPSEKFQPKGTDDKKDPTNRGKKKELAENMDEEVESDELEEDTGDVDDTEHERGAEDAEDAEDAKEVSQSRRQTGGNHRES